MILLCSVMNLPTETNRFCLEEMLMLNTKSHLQKYTVSVWFDTCERVSQMLSPSESAGVVSKVGLTGVTLCAFQC